jgi:LacI family transcriptional regulator
LQPYSVVEVATMPDPVQRDRSPLREQLEDALRRQILDGRFEYGTRLPSVRELSAQFGAGKTTVADAICRLVQQGLLHTVEKKGVFLCGPTDSKRRYHKRRTGNIGVFAHGHGDILRARIYFEAFDGIRKAAAAAGCQVLYLGAEPPPVRERRQPRLPLGFRDIDGLIYIVCSRPSRGFAKEIMKRGVPLVTFDAFDPELNADGVVLNNVAGAAAMMRHLLKLGHRRIACLNSTGGQSAEERLLAYRTVLEEFGIAYAPALVRAIAPNMISGREAMRDLLRYLPTAVFTFNDYLGLGAFLAAEAANRSVPADFSIGSFGNEAAGLGGGLGLRLTTVAVDMVAMGKASAEALLKRINGYAGPPQRICIEGKLVRGDTTAPCKSQKENADTTA